AGINVVGVDAEAEPPDGEFAEAIEGVGRGKGDAVVGTNGVREAKFFEGALEDGEGELLLGGGERLAREEVAGGEVGDRQRIAVAAVAGHEIALVIGAPKGLGGGGAAGLGTVSAIAPAAAVLDEAVAVEDGVNGGDRRQMRQLRALPELFADLRGAPARILSLEPDNHSFDRRRKTIGLPKRPAAAIGERGQATVF